jgi:hypothetical protein
MKVLFVANAEYSSLTLHLDWFLNLPRPISDEYRGKETGALKV